jgi:putative proteasome-type protease
MTYCLGILLPGGLVLAADSRSNAGVDQITRVHKLALISKTGERVIAILSAGNLATTQAVVTSLQEALGSGDRQRDLYTARTMFDAANILGGRLREVIDHDGRYVQPYGDASASFLLGGQIAGEKHRLFEIYSAGNFIEASDRKSFLQIGETKYGKPILDRALIPELRLDGATKLALLSFDATIRSNLSVGMPIDILRYQADSFTFHDYTTLDEDNAYWRELRDGYANGLRDVLADLPLPPQSWDA